MASPSRSSESDSDREVLTSENSDSDQDFGPEICLDLDGNIQPYQFEPEYASDELDEHEEDVDVEMAVNRLEDSSW